MINLLELSLMNPLIWPNQRFPSKIESRQKSCPERPNRSLKLLRMTTRPMQPSSSLESWTKTREQGLLPSATIARLLMRRISRISPKSRCMAAGIIAHWRAAGSFWNPKETRTEEKQLSSSRKLSGDFYLCLLVTYKSYFTAFSKY